MEPEYKTDYNEDNKDLNHSRQSRSIKKISSVSSSPKHKKDFKENNQDVEEKSDGLESRSKTRTRRSDPDPDPDRDKMSDREGRRSSQSYYSDDYDTESPSDRSLPPYSRSRTPSPVHHRGMRTKRNSGSPVYRTGGLGRLRLSHPLRPGGQPQHRKGVHSQSKESAPPKDLDLVTKRMLSARLLKINDLRNSLAELQQRADELQKENRILRQLQVRQEKALQRYDDTESEISQLLARHSNEVHVLRERLRRTQERERAAERRYKDSEEQLHRSQATIAKLKKLVMKRELGEREELSRSLEGEKTRAQEAERKIKELERSAELSNSSFQRQLAAEKKKTINAQEEVRTLQEELERLTNKLKEKERELDARNIYANRTMKYSSKRDVENGAKMKASSRNSSKAVQTKDRSSSPDFPTPPPAVTDPNESNDRAPDEYLSLKEFSSANRQEETEERHQNEEQQRRKDKDEEPKSERKEKHQPDQESTVLEEKSNSLTKGLENAKEEEDRKRTSSLFKEERESILKHGHVQEEVNRWNQETLANQQAAEEARQKKELLLAKMREIDLSTKRAQDAIFSESGPSESNAGMTEHSSPRPPEQRNSNSSIFDLTETEERAGSREGGRRRSGVEGGAFTTGLGRRALRSQISDDDLAFGSYAPSFVNSTSRGSPGFPPPPPAEDRDSALEAIGVFSLRGTETEKRKESERVIGKDRKSSLMQQLFGVTASNTGDSVSHPNKMEVLSSPPLTNGMRSRREGLFSFSSEQSTPSASSLNTVHVAESRPAVRAITSFNDDDIEELTL